MQKMTSVKSNTLKDIREYYNASLNDVCARTKIKIEKLRMFESGDDYPSYSQLEKLADYYNKPLFFFFFNEPCMNNEVKVAFRKFEENYGSDLMSKRNMELVEKADMYKMNLYELYEGEDIEKFSQLISSCSSKNELIEFLRLRLKLSLKKQTEFGRPEDLLEYLREEFYELGVYVFKDSFKNDRISGLCLYDSVFPIVLLNNKTSFKRQIFTLLHEVYHLYLKETDIDLTDGTEESECNKFASLFLIPNDDLIEQLNVIDDIEDIYNIDRLAKRYNVSRDSIMYRLLKMGKIDGDFYTKNKVGCFREASNSSGGNFYHTKMSYLGDKYLNKVFNAYYNGNLTKSQVGVYTGLKSIHVSKLASKWIGGAF